MRIPFFFPSDIILTMFVLIFNVYNNTLQINTRGITQFNENKANLLLKHNNI